MEPEEDYDVRIEPVTQPDEQLHPPEPALLRALASALRSLSKSGRESVYEVDVIMRCSPAPPWSVHAAFWWCYQRGWLAPSSNEPDAFVIVPGAFSALESGSFQRVSVASVAEA